MNNKNLKIGQIINFGNYAGEKIEWEVLEINDENVVLVSKKILDTMIFDNAVSKWENSKICLWLNNEFYNEAFNKEERRQMIPYIDENEYNKTQKKVFLLSKDEVLRYYKTEKERVKYSTNYAKKRGLITESGNKNNKQIYNDSACWWTRTENEEYIIFGIGSRGLLNLNYIEMKGLGVVPTIKLRIN